VHTGRVPHGQQDEGISGRVTGPRQRQRRPARGCRSPRRSQRIHRLAY
jgi:hypothetical protein